MLHRSWPIVASEQRLERHSATFSRFLRAVLFIVVQRTYIYVEEEPEMTRRPRRFGPILEEFENKTLLSAGGIGHLSGAPHQAVDDVAAKFKFYFVLQNQTSKKDLPVVWKLDTNGHHDEGRVTVSKTRQAYVKSNAIESGGIASIKVTYDGKTVPVYASISKPERDPAPPESTVPVTTLT
jgi:hypothetical protein